MPEIFGNVQQQLNEFWQGLEKGQRVKLLSIIGICTLIIVLGVYALSKPKYEVLYSKLSSQDMSSAVKVLEERGIGHKISEDATSLSVVSSKKGEAKLALSEAGVPKTNATFADASVTKLGQTQSDKDRQYIDYLEQKLSRDLVQDSGSILAADVRITIPQNTGFFGDDKKSTASVKITPSSELSPSQVEGIARFIANSVQGLDPKNVEVVDNDMRVLKEKDGTLSGQIDKQYGMQQTIKKNLENEIKDMLSNESTEFDESKVVANLVLDFDAEITSEQIVEPVIEDNGIIVSKSEQSETLINGATGGVPGTDSNTSAPSYPAAGTGSGSSYSKTDNITNYEINKTNRQITKAIGQVDRDKSTMAISLYYGRKVDQAPSQEVIKKVTELVSMASGIATDKIKVNSIPLTKETNTKTTTNYIYLLQEYGAFALAVLLIGLLAVAVLTGSKRVKVERLAHEPVVSSRLPDMHVEEIQVEEKSEVKKQIDKFIKQKPDNVANLLRNWLTEDWD